MFTGENSLRVHPQLWLLLSSAGNDGIHTDVPSSAGSALRQEGIKWGGDTRVGDAASWKTNNPGAFPVRMMLCLLEDHVLILDKKFSRTLRFLDLFSSGMQFLPA